MAGTPPPYWSQAIKARRENMSHRTGDKITQEEIAARTGEALSQRTISHLEKGTIDITSLAYSRVVALARALGWTLPELQAATGVDLGLPQQMEDAEGNATLEQVEEPDFQLPEGLQEAVDEFGDRYTDLRDPKWQRYLSKFRWRTGQPTEPERWLDAYRDLIRNGIEPGEA